ncbi:MAG: phosphoglycolate phosphatase [Candidatus Paceibacteria bacterium]|jgi:phosphoglycolate phosphatase
MARPDFPFDAMLFDLDGTLLATDRFWIPAARVGSRRAFEELGLQREMPSAEQWMSLVGLPLAEGFDMLFADLDPAQRERIMARCVEEEHFALESGSAALLPGVIDALTELAARGVPMGIASNCSQSYLDSAMSKVELAKFISEGRCLDSRGIRNKAEMIEDLLLTFGTRSAVMVGDRAGDRDAAHANGLPHVHLENGFAPRAEEVKCEARIVDFGELIPRLDGRTRWIDRTLADLGFGRPGAGPRSLGVTGHSGAGKSILASDIVRRLHAQGQRAVLVPLEGFLNSALPATDLSVPSAPQSALDLPGQIYCMDDLIASVLEPHLAHEPVELELELARHSTTLVSIAPDDVLVLEGEYLLHPRLRALLDRVLFMEAPREVLLRRIASRELPLGRATELERIRQQSLPDQERFDQLCPPASGADLVLDHANPLGPAEA